MDVRRRKTKQKAEMEGAAADAMAVLRGLKRRTNVVFICRRRAIKLHTMPLAGKEGERRKELRLKKEASTQFQVFAHQFDAIFI